jgi:hypothetical protein
VGRRVGRQDSLNSEEKTCWPKWLQSGTKIFFLGPFLPSRSRIHERTISLRFLGIILRVLRLEVSVYNVYGTLQTSFNPLFLKGGRAE